jgi:hypothetical protein
MTAINGGVLEWGSLLVPCYFPCVPPAKALFTSCSEFALARRKAHGIKSLDACGDQKCEISPVFFPDHGNLANLGLGVETVPMS